MKELTKNEMLPKLFAGERVRAVKWDNVKYIEVKAGQVVTNEGKEFDVMKARDSKWVVWTAPVVSDMKTMSRDEALTALYSGKRVKAVKWEKGRELFVKDGQILVNGSKVFDITKAREKEWVIVQDEPTNMNAVAVEVASLKEVVQELTEHTKEDSLSVLEGIESLKEMMTNLVEEKVRGARDGRNADEQAKGVEIVKAVYGVATPAKIEALFKERLESAESSRDIERTIVEFIPYCWIGGRTLGTVAVYYTNMRRVIKELEDDTYKELALALFLPPQSLYEASQRKVDDNKKEKIRNKNTFNPAKINELLATIKEKLEEDDFSEKPRQISEEREKAYWAYAYLTLTTGRRQAEILKSLSIVKNGDSWEYCGISKDREGGKCIKAYALDDDYEFLNELLEYIQNHIGSDEMTQKQINSKFNNSFNGALKRITGTSFTAKEWREIYTEMMWLKEGKKEGSNIDKRDFRAEILGHEYDGRLSATEHYESWESREEEEGAKDE